MVSFGLACLLAHLHLFFSQQLYTNFVYTLGFGPPTNKHDLPAMFGRCNTAACHVDAWFCWQPASPSKRVVANAKDYTLLTTYSRGMFISKQLWPLLLGWRACAKNVHGVLNPLELGNPALV